MGQRKCHFVHHFLDLVTLTAHAELLLMCRQRWATASRSSGVNLEEEAPVALVFLCCVLRPLWTYLLFCLNLVGLLSERDMMLLEVDGRSDLNSSSSGKK